MCCSFSEGLGNVWIAVPHHLSLAGVAPCLADQDLGKQEKAKPRCRGEQETNPFDRLNPGCLFLLCLSAKACGWAGQKAALEEVDGLLIREQHSFWDTHTPIHNVHGNKQKKQCECLTSGPSAPGRSPQVPQGYDGSTWCTYSLGIDLKKNIIKSTVLSVNTAIKYEIRNSHSHMLDLKQEGVGILNRFWNP